MNYCSQIYTTILYLMLIPSAAGAASSQDSVSPAKFVGSSSCIQCHQLEYDNWQKSDHYQAMRPANEDSVLGDFDNVTLSFHGIETRLYRKGEAFMVDTTGQNGVAGVFTIAYSFGHYPLQQYLIDIGKGHLQALNVAWDARPVEQGGQRWYHLQADEDIDPQHPFFWTRHFQNANSRCIECHATDVSKNYNPEDESYDTSWSEVGVTCESCHGPASQHLALAQADQVTSRTTGFDKPSQPKLSWTFRGNDSIASPSGIRDDSFIDTCGGCHSRRSTIGDVKPLAPYHDQYRLALLDQGLYHSDGQINDEVFVLGSFLQSKMQRKGVTCANCHDAHSGKLIAAGNVLCAQCHKPAVFDNSEHHHHPAASAGAQCVACHMPEKTYMGVDQRRDHSFSIPDPQLSTSAGSPNACTDCHQDKDNAWAGAALASWKITPRPQLWAVINQGMDRQDAKIFRDYAQNELLQDQASIRQATVLSKLSSFPSRLAMEKASAELANPDPLVRRAAVTSLQAMPFELRWQLLNPLIDDPLKVIRLEVASALADGFPQLEGGDRERLDRLLDEYREALQHIADTPSGQLAIGNLELRLGYSILAERAYLRALAIEPRFVPALINLSDLYRSMGSDGEAEKLLQLALEIEPDSANTNHAYGLFLIRSGKQDEALEYLEAAIGKENSTPRHIYVYAVALDSRGQIAAAMEIINRQSKRWPNNLELAFLQISYMEKTGNTAGVNRYLSLLASFAANNPRVRRWMEMYGGKVN